MATSNGGKKRWQEETLEPARERSPERAKSFTTVSGEAIEPLYTPDDVPDFEHDRELGYPGEPPYTRGVHPTMYR